MLLIRNRWIREWTRFQSKIQMVSSDEHSKIDFWILQIPTQQQKNRNLQQLHHLRIVSWLRYLNESPCPDGISCKDSKVPWNIFSSILIDLQNYSSDRKELLEFQKLYLLKMIPKTGKDLWELKNWTLLNCIKLWFWTNQYDVCEN